MQNIKLLSYLFVAVVISLLLPSQVLLGTEFVKLNKKNWKEYAPSGKEVDCIYGDTVLRNDKIVAVIADAVPTRNANLNAKNVGGNIIDLTQRKHSNDQLTAFFAATGFDLQFDEYQGTGVSSGPQMESRSDEPTTGSAKTIKLIYKAHAVKKRPAVKVTYTLSDGDDFVLVTTEFKNPHKKPVSIMLRDPMRADVEFTKGISKDLELYWTYDNWWGQAYGVVPDVSNIEIDLKTLAPKNAKSKYQFKIKYNNKSTGKEKLRLAPGKTFEYSRRIFPGKNLFEINGIARRLTGNQVAAVNLSVKDSNGPVANAFVSLTQAGNKAISGRTDKRGKLIAYIAPGEHAIEIEALGRPALKSEIKIELSDENAKKYADAKTSGLSMNFKMESCGYVFAKITNEQGGVIPCKVDFLGVDGTESPHFGPDSNIHGVRNLYYTQNGKFKTELAPGTYSVLISHGPEYDAILKKITVKQGKTASISAKLIRTVDTSGWLSAELHSHSSPSGDNVTSQRGRVLNHLAEHIEFAPCTEHNRISSYSPHLKFFKAEKLLATCTGMELTGRPSSVDHQNAFPLKHHPHTQDGGGPHTHTNPEIQIERLAMWDNNSEKVIQVNHPNIPQILGDKDLDGTPDGGFSKVLSTMDIIEIHPPHYIFNDPPFEYSKESKNRTTRVFHWLQLLNLGYRVPGAVNSDAHRNFHGVGFKRNYIKSPTDNPAKAKIPDLCSAIEHGAFVMTNGPFMEVKASTKPFGGNSSAGPGDDIKAEGGKVELHVRIQCSNWLDVNRVQVFVNGRPLENLNFKRKTHPSMFSKGVVRFKQKIVVKLQKDAHIIVATIGEGLTLGRVYQPDSKVGPPVAISNPIYVDVDGNGFQANGDLLGVPLPLEKTKLPHGHAHSHDEK